MAALLSLLALAAAAGYFLLWWLVPREDLPESAMQRLSRRYPSARRWPGLALLGLGLVFLLDRLSVWRADVVLAFALIAGGVLLYRRGDAQDWRAPAEPAPMPTDLPQQPATAATVAFDDAVARVLPPRERSALGWTTLGIALLVVGGAVIWVTATDATPRLVTIPALALLVLSAGLLVGTVFGRARWLVAPGAPARPGRAVRERDPTADRRPLRRHHRHSTGPRAGSPPRTTTTAGGIFLDLTRLRSRAATCPVTATAIVSATVQVVVPYDAHVIVDGRTGYRQRQPARCERRRPRRLASTVQSEPRFGDGMTIHLMLETGIGNVDVYREYLSSKQVRQLRHDERLTYRGTSS